METVLRHGGNCRASMPRGPRLRRLLGRTPKTFASFTNESLDRIASECEKVASSDGIMMGMFLRAPIMIRFAGDLRMMNGD